MSRTKQVRKQQGVTLLGVCISLAISATLVGNALPSLRGSQQHQQLRVVADQLRTDIQDVRQQAVSHGRNLQLHVQSACYIVHDGDKGACRCDEVRREAVCMSPAQVLKVQWTAVSLASNTTQDLTFSALHGTVSPTARLTLRSRSGEELAQKIAITGRVQTCSVGKASSGLTAC